VTYGQSVLIIFGLLTVVHPAAYANGCSGQKLTATVRNCTPDRDASYKMEYAVSDTCPEDNEIEKITIGYKTKTLLADGSITEKEQIIKGIIHPYQSHVTVIATQLYMLAGEKEILEAVVTSAAIDSP
jgi:hypothetical protein